MADDLFADIQGDDLFGDIKVPKGKPGVRAALIDIMKNRRGRRTAVDVVRGTAGKPNIARSTDYGVGSAAADAATLGLTTQANAGIGALITGLQRAVPGGKQPTYTAKDYYDASRLFEAAQREKFAADHPVQNVTANIVGALGMPGAKQAAKFVVGKTAPALATMGKEIPRAVRAAQVARTSGVAGTMGATQGALQARPGEEVSEAKRAGTTAAIAAPILGKAAEYVPGAVRATTRLARRAVGAGTSAAITSVEKLQKTLRQAGVTEDAINAVKARWDQMGGVTPALIDLVKEAGGSAEVLGLLAKSPAKAPVRVAAANNAKAVTEAVEPTLKTAMRTSPPPTVAPETGAAKYADELNTLFDKSRKKYKADFKIAEAASPETAIVDEDEVRPFFDKMAVPQNYEEALPGVSAVKRYLDKKREMIAGRADPSDWPEGESLTLPTPLTMLELQKMRQALGHYGSKYADEAGGALAGDLKGVLNSEIDRLVTENKMSGDPAILDKWKAAIAGYGEHKANFGEGLPAKLTARKPNGEREVPSNLAAETIFGSKSLNKTLDELGGSLDLVSPEAVRALREELYGRVKPADLPKLRETSGGKRLLPEDLVDEAKMADVLEAVPEQAKTARELQAVVEGSASKNTPILETVTPGDIAYPTRGTADFGLKFWRMLGRLSGPEYEAALKTLTSKDPDAQRRLLDGLMKKYPRAARAVAPALARPMVTTGDSGAEDALVEDYGLTEP